MSKLDPHNLVPDGYEILETLVASESAWEYLASHKTDNTLVRLKVYSFADTTEATRHRHIRSYLRKDVGFLDELDHSGIIKLYDYSETRQLFWLAIQPTDIQKLSDVFPQIASLPLETKVALIGKLFSIVEYIHSREVVHRNLSSEGIYLGPKLDLYVGDFGLACYLEDASTSGYSTTSTSTLGAAYQAPEIKDAQTAFLDFRSDVFTAGLLAIEILCGKPVPKDTQKDFSKTLRQYLEQHGVVKYAGPAVCKVLLKAIRSDAEKRWVTIKDLSNAFAKALQDKSVGPMATVNLTGTIGITETLQPSHKVDGIIPTETIGTEGESAEPFEAGVLFTPLNSQNEIWNNRYEIIEKIGGGGQAIVYKAFDHLTNEEIAIKTLLSRHRKDKHAINRLKQEAMVARSLTHRYIIKTYSVEQRTDISHGSESVFLCMELITSGLELKDVISKRHASGLKFGVDEVLHITRQLLDALKYAHSFTVHRDIKPGNIMLVPHDGHSEDDTSDLTKFDIILMDFGIAKVLTQKRIEVTGKGFWSAHYGAPELADSKSTVDPRADLYSVGVIMYQMFTGHIPRKGSQSVNKVNKNVSVVLAKVIDRAIDADREKRFKNAAAFIREIDKAVSRFSWVVKTAKVAILMILTVILAVMVSKLIPETDKMIVQEGIDILNARASSEVIASFANVSGITYNDLEGYEGYNSFREATLKYLGGYQDPDEDMFPISYTSWREQDKEWEKIELLADKVKRIGSFREGHADFEKLSVLEHLQELKPSSTFLEEIRKKTERAEKLLDKRPLSKDILEECENSYALIATSYGYIKRVDEKIINDYPMEDLRAEEINKKLVNLDELQKTINKLEEEFQLAIETLSQIPELQEKEFKESFNKCLARVEEYRNQFELEEAKEYLSLLNQIFGTLVGVKDQIDFSDSRIEPIISRLMQLCYEEIETFEKYPEATAKLTRVHEQKELLTKYKTLCKIISAGPKANSQEIYDLMEATRNKGNTKKAREKLQETAAKYNKFLADKAGELEGDYDVLSAESDTVIASKEDLQALRKKVLESDWPNIQDVEEYKSYSDTAKEYLTQEADRLRKNITKSISLAKTKYRWISQTIPAYTNIAQQYTGVEINESIKNWKDVDDTHRLCGIKGQIQKVDILLSRKVQLDQLASRIDEGIEFCERFKGTSAQEKSKRERWLDDLKIYRAKLIEKDNGEYLVDASEFDSKYNNTRDSVEEIHAQFPVHSNRVEHLVSQAKFLEDTGLFINKSLDSWRSIVGLGEIGKITFKSAAICEDLNKLKADVDNWDGIRFNREMQPKCEDLAKVIDGEIYTLRFILAAIKDLDTRISNILSDRDIRELNAIAKVNGKKFVFDQLRDLFDQCRKILDEIEPLPADAWQSVFPVESYADFDTANWLEKYNDAQRQLKAQIAQLQRIQSNLSEEAVQQLIGQVAVEKLYFSDLKGAVITELKQQHVEIGDKIDAAEENASLMEMCTFLEKIGDDSIPKLQILKQAHSNISSEITELESFAVESLSAIKGFNDNRRKVLDSFAVCNGNLAKLNESDVELACKTNIENISTDISKLIKRPDRTKLLWAFYAKNRTWEQWQKFFDVFHIKIADNGSVQLNSLPQLELLNNHGSLLKETEIITNPQKFFHVDTDEQTNFGWPKYARAKDDPTVQFVFIPVGNGNPQPFYMAIREITNAQYCVFLNKNGIQNTSQLEGWSMFSNQEGKQLISCASFDYPPCAIKHDGTRSGFIVSEADKNIPVTWVTFDGADSYAKWLSGQLPTTSQYKYACQANAITTYPWGNDLDQIQLYAHVRATAWQQTASEYNSKKDNPLEMAHPPIGAVKEFKEDKTLDITKVLHKNTVYNSTWPLATTTKPNAWGLYDMIGNVWEWCINDKGDTQSVICGGSCLASPKYVTPESRYNFKGKASDVGFRIIIPAK